MREREEAVSQVHTESSNDSVALGDPADLEARGSRLEQAQAVDLVRRDAEAGRLRRQHTWVKARTPQIQFTLLVFGVLALLSALFGPRLWIYQVRGGIPDDMLNVGERQRPWILGSCMVILSSALVHVLARRSEETLRRRAAELGLDLDAPP